MQFSGFLAQNDILSTILPQNDFDTFSGYFKDFQNENLSFNDIEFSKGYFKI